MVPKIKKVSRETFIVLLLTFSLFSLFTPTVLNAKDNIGIIADSSILIDAENGSIFNSSNEDEVHGIASITKLMTYYVVLNEMEKQKLELTDTITISEKASQIKAQFPESSGAYLTEGSKMTYDQAINQLLVVSDNGVAVALAENISGSEDEFVTLMNETAQELNMSNTTFYNASGLSNDSLGEYGLDTSENVYNKSTSFDVALMSLKVLNKYPDTLDITSKTYIQYEGDYYSGHNYMIEPDSLFYYKGVKGLKTGTSEEAGSCFVGYYENEKTDEKYISVVLGAGSSNDVFNQTTYIYNWIDMQEQYNIISEDYMWDVEIKGDNKKSHQQLHSSKEFQSTENLYLDAEVEKYEYNDKYFNDKNELVTNIPPGEKIVTIYLNPVESDHVAENILSEEPANKEGKKVLRVDLVSDQEIKKESILRVVTEGIKGYFISLYNNIF